MRTQNTTTGAGNTTAAQPIDAAHAIYCDHDFNKGPLVCYVHDIGEAALIAEALGQNPLDVKHALDMRVLTRTSDDGPDGETWGEYVRRRDNRNA